MPMRLGETPNVAACARTTASRAARRPAASDRDSGCPAGTSGRTRSRRAPRTNRPPGGLRDWPPARGRPRPVRRRWRSRCRCRGAPGTPSASARPGLRCLRAGRVAVPETVGGDAEERVLGARRRPRRAGRCGLGQARLERLRALPPYDKIAGWEWLRRSRLRTAPTPTTPSCSTASPRARWTPKGSRSPRCSPTSRP